jgi:hypothetical protein
MAESIITKLGAYIDLLCGLAVIVPGYISRDPCSIGGATRFSAKQRGLERGSLSLVSTIEELGGRKSSGSGLENRDYGRRGSVAFTTRHSYVS